jgi:RNA polymerase sigma-70 factor (ECF subfamily)
VASPEAKAPHIRLVPPPSTAQGESADPAELLARAADGDPRAEETLFRRHAPLLARVATRILQGDRAEGEDVAQEALAIAFARLDTVREPQAFRGWLVTITVRLARRVLARRRWTRLFGEAPPPGLVTLALPDATAEARAELALLDGALAQLAVDDRVAWILRHVEGLELTEVASACGCSLATAKRRIARAHGSIVRVVRFEETADE